MDNKYSRLYYNNQVETNKVWQKFMDKSDVLDAINNTHGRIAHMSKYSPHKLNKEDMRFLEMPLGELEIALRKINKIPTLFEFDEAEIKEIYESYNILRKKVEEINLQRISWD